MSGDNPGRLALARSIATRQGWSVARAQEIIAVEIAKLALRREQGVLTRQDIADSAAYLQRLTAMKALSRER